ncbi:MAG: xanthine dehydrogenase family protein molybdopterin-binding subunit [Acidimicrobiales bacterium]
MTTVACRWVGRGIPQIDIDQKLNGSAEYVADLRVPGMLHGAIVRAPIAHGRILHIDTARAWKVPGVRAIVLGSELPIRSFGPYIPDWVVLARDKVLHVGDEVAAVAATTPEAAKHAAELVQVAYEELPAVFDPRVVIAGGGPPIHDESPDNVAYRFAIERGDVAAAMDSADRVFSDTYETSRIYHGYLEPIGCVAVYEAGRFLLHVPTHIPFRARLTYAAALGVPVDHVQLRIPEIGGSFGAKYEMNAPIIAAVLAERAGAPVRILFDREEDAANAHPRPGFIFHHTIAIDDQGRFVARMTDVLGTAGARTYWSPVVIATAVHRVDSLYHFGSMSGVGRLVYTNECPTTCMRGFGNAEALFGIEQLIDHIANEIGDDPVELRRRNAVCEGDTTLHGWRISSSKLRNCLDRVVELSGYAERRHKPDVARLVEGGVLRGIGLAIAHHVSGYRTILRDYDGSSAILRLGGDGSIAVFIGEPDIGQGERTVVAQLVAERLGVNPDVVAVHNSDTALSPASVGTLASRAATMSGMAVLAACDHAINLLVEHLADQWSVGAGAIEFTDGRFVVADDGSGAPRTATLGEVLKLFAIVNCGLPLLAQGVHRPPTEIPDANGYGNPSAAYPFAAHVAEIEVDVETGQVRVSRYWAVHDSGTILNPSTARGQVVGGIAQGIGWALTEEVVCRDGRVRNPNFLDYRIPGAGDIPAVDVEFVAGYEPNGPMGAKSLAEVAINPVIAAIANAFFDATGVRPHEMPLSPERVWELLRLSDVGVGA